MRKYTALILFIITLASCSLRKKVGEGEMTRSEIERIKFTALYIKATNMAMLENTDNAILMYEQCRELKPKNATVYYELSRLYAVKRNAPKAYENAKKAYELNPSNKWYLLQRAVVLKATGQTKKAILAYEELMEVDTKNISVLYELAQMYQDTEEPKKAAEVIGKIEGISGKNPQMTYQKYMLLMDAGEEKEALNEVGQMLKQDPENGMANLAMAQFHEKSGQHDKVYKNMVYVFEDAAIRTETKLSILIDYIKKSTADSQKKTEAENLINIMQRVHPKDVKSYVAAGDFYNGNNPQKAKENYEEALKYSTNSHPIYLQLLDNAFVARDYKKVVEYASSAIELYPTQPVFFLYQGMGNKELKEYKDAITSFNSGQGVLIDDEKMEFKFYSKMGETYNEMKDYPNSDKFYEKAMNLNGLEPFMLNNYSYYLSLRKDKLERAAELSKKANNIYPKNASFNDTYGWILFQQANYKDAEIWIKRSLENGGNKSGTVLEHYGDVMIQLNNAEKALEYWNLAKKSGEHTEKLSLKIKEKKYYE